jgi:hypothetical protein
MIAELEQRRDLVADLDEVERSLTIADLSGDIGPELRRLRLYQTSLHTRLRWLIDQVNGKKDPNRKIVAWLRDRPMTQAEPAPPPEAKTPD